MTFRKTLLFLITGISLFCLSLTAQNPKADSLKKVLKELPAGTNDTIRVSILISICEALPVQEVKPYAESCREICMANIKTDRKNKDFFLKGMAASLNQIAMAADRSGDAAAALDNHLKSLKILEELNDKRGIAAELSNLGIIYKTRGDNNKALEFHNRSLKLREEIRDSAGISESLNNIGIVYKYLGDSKKAIDYYSRAFQITKLSRNTKSAAMILNNIGGIYLSQGDISKALEYFHRGLKIWEENGDLRGAALSLSSIASLYSQQGDMQKAIEYHEKSLKINEKNGDKRGVGACLINIGAIYKDIDLNRALDYYFKGLGMMEALGDKLGISSCLNNIGKAYFLRGETKKALDYYKKSLSIMEEIGNKEGMSYLLNNIASATLKSGSAEEAKKYATKSLALGRELGFPENIRKAAATLKDIYKKQKNFKEALAMYSLEIQMSDSINNEKNRKATIKKDLQYQYEKKTAADSTKNAEAQKVKNAQLLAQQAELKHEKTQRFLLYSGLIIIIAFLAFVFNRFRVTQKQKAVIENQKLLVDKAYAELHEKNKEVTDSIYYARRIQRSLLPTDKYIRRALDREKTI
jgi:tetratricopeptide (TPR) repeat protein